MGEEAGSNTLEMFKALSTFISSVVLAATGLLVTNCYNGQQLEIARNKELSTHLPKLGSPDVPERRAAALALSLYGEEVVPPLIAVLGDTSAQVRDAVVTALVAVGKPAEDDVARAFIRSVGQSELRAASLKAWGLIGEDSLYDIAKEVLLDSREGRLARYEAADVMIRFRNDLTLSHFLTALRFTKDEDPEVAKILIYYLPFLEGARLSGELIEMLHHPDPEVREWAIWAIAKLSSRDPVAKKKFHEVIPTINCDSVQRVRDAVIDASSRLGFPRVVSSCPQITTGAGSAIR